MRPEATLDGRYNPSATMGLSSGTKLGPYEIGAPLGAGGMGEVYRARDTRLDRSVAIKILPAHLADKADASERFEREARTISSLNHPNICQLHDVGKQDGVRYLVMELLEGETLAERLRRGPLPMEQVLRYGAEIATGLQAAHRCGVVHRDLKPGNIMLTKSGAKLMDFGLAKGMTPPKPLSAELTATLTSSHPTPLTQQGTIVGTFQYMAPEQVEGKEADARSDIFSLGAVLYEMVCGKRAFEGKTLVSVAASILGERARADPDAAAADAAVARARDQEMPGKGSRRTLAERRRSGERVEMDCGRICIGSTCCRKPCARTRHAGERVAGMDVPGDGGDCGRCSQSGPRIFRRQQAGGAHADRAIGEAAVQFRGRQWRASGDFSRWQEHCLRGPVGREESALCASAG